MGKVTTHVLDTALGRPAANLRIDLRDVDGQLLRTVTTNADGRADSPLLQGGAFAAGTYQLCFHVADYFRANQVDLPEPPFLDVVTIAFGVADASGNYHVPLLVAPFGYSTYRGS